MTGLGSIVRGVAVAVAAVGIAALPSVASAQGNGPAQGTLTIEVDLTGDAGGDATAISFLVTRNTTTGNNDTVVNGQGQSSAQTFTLDAGAYLISASASDPAYSITGVSCIENPPNNGPGTPDFIVPSDGTVACTISATYTAPAPTEPPTDSTVPPTDSTVPPTDSTVPPTDSTTPEVTDPTVTTTTIDQGVLPPAGGDDTTSGTPSGTMPVTGPGETTAIALTGLGALLLGAGALTAARRH